MKNASAGSGALSGGKMKKIKITVQEIGFLGISTRICCNLSPIEMFFRHRAVERELKNTITTYGIYPWKVEFAPKGKNKPLRCEKHKGHWHYIAYS